MMLGIWEFLLLRPALTEWSEPELDASVWHILPVFGLDWIGLGQPTWGGGLHCITRVWVTN